VGGGPSRVEIAQACGFGAGLARRLLPLGGFLLGVGEFPAHGVGGDVLLAVDLTK